MATAPGWAADFIIGPTPLAGSNGLRFGADGALYVAQANSGRIGRIDLADSRVDVLSTSGGDMIGPDDLAFDSRGNLFITEVMGARVRMRRPNGSLSIIAGDTPAANGITVDRDRIFMSEFNPEGRILELSAEGAAPRTIASGLMMPNALQLGPDDMLYFPLVPLGEIWRVALDGTQLERVSGGLVMPTAAKFDPDGRLWAVEAATGGIHRIDITNGSHVETLRVAPGVDNFVFRADGTMFVSHFTDGEIVEIGRDGTIREIIGAGMLGPFGIAATADGHIVAADGGSIANIAPDGTIRRLSIMVQPGAPGYARGIAVSSDGSLLITNSAGQLARFRPGTDSEFLVNDLQEAIGVTSDGHGGAYLCEAGAGRVLAVDADGRVSVLADHLDRPTGIHRLGDGSLIVSEAGAGRLLHLNGGGTSTLLDGLAAPHGVAATAAGVFVLDYDTAGLHFLPAGGGAAQVIATNLPVGHSLGGRPEGLPGIAGILPGPILPFGGLCALPDGSLAIGADAVGAIIRLTRTQGRVVDDPRP